MLGTILLIILILLLVGALPTWPYSGGWGYYPSSGLGLLLIIIIVLLAFGRIYRWGGAASAGSTCPRASPQYLYTQRQGPPEPQRKSGVIRDTVIGERVHE